MMFSYEGQKENLVDPILERLDPTPNIHDLFRQFNARFFWGKLDMVEVTWSGKRMTSCAGLCQFEGRSGHTKIVLSAPLLSLRSRKDLVETLLIYHSFNDEVRHFQSHVWRCNGSCQKTRPFFGIVRRSTNRAPGPNDSWWDRHKMACSGTFEKIEEPAGYKSKKKGTSSVKGGAANPVKDIRNFFTPTQTSTSKIHTFTDLKDGAVHAGGSYDNLKNKGIGVVLGKSTNQNSTPTKPSSKKVPSATSLSNTKSSSDVQQQLRNIWGNKFPEKRKMPSETSVKEKKVIIQCERCDSLVANCDMTSHRLLCKPILPSPVKEVSIWKNHPCPVCGTPVKDNGLEEHLNSCLSESIIEDVFGEEEARSVNDGIGNDDKSVVPCPICAVNTSFGDINKHIDECLNLVALRS